MNPELLLAEISHLNKRAEERDRLSGDRFNIFNILNLSSDEISHSKIIASLLDPKGTHGKGNVFIGLFLKHMGMNEYSDNFSCDNVTVETEKFIGYISEDHETGGRIDIVIKNITTRKQIFIENKIYASDGWKQLSRYQKYDPDAELIYLTLYGTKPSEESTGELGESAYRAASYREHILGWLEACKGVSIDKPLLRETIAQYINLIKQLTGQARSGEMQKELMEIIFKDAGNIEAVFTLSQNIDAIKRQILEKKFIPLMKELAQKLGLEVKISLDGCFERYWWFSFKRPCWKRIGIIFESEAPNLQDLIYAAGGDNLSNELNDYLRGLAYYKKSKGCPIYQYMDKYRRFDNNFYIELFSNAENISNVFESKIKELLLVIEDKGYDL